MIQYDKVLLYEKHDVKTSEVITTEANTTHFIHGAKIFRVIKPIFKGRSKKPIDFLTLCQYDSSNDVTDLNNLTDYLGYQMVSVDISDYDKETFQWNVVTLSEASEDKRVFTITDNRKCTDEEVELLNKIFPEYYDNCFYIKDGKKITPKSLVNEE